MPLHLAARCSSSEAVVQALLAAYPEAAMAPDKVRRQRQHRWRVVARRRRARAHAFAAPSSCATRLPPAVRFTPDDPLAPPTTRPPRARAAGFQDAGQESQAQ